MAKRHSQQSLIDMWHDCPKRSRPDATTNDPASSVSKTVSESEVRISGVASSIPLGTEISSTATESSTATSSEGMSQPGCSACTHPCCTDSKPFQPENPVVLASLVNKGRNFVVEWFKQFPWLTLCLTKKKVFCFYCRYTSLHQLLIFSKNCSPAFISDGFNNWKKAMKKFNDHESSHTHLEARMKWEALR